MRRLWDVLLTSRKVIKKPPFRIDEKGWGEFDMTIVLTAIGKGGDHTLDHDLNFQAERYEAKHQVVRFTTTTQVYFPLPEKPLILLIIDFP
jgi:transcription initiation factor IIF auxiliary subunit